MNKRLFKNYILDKKFQGKLILFFFLVNILTIASLYFASFRFFVGFVHKGVEVGIPKGHIFYQFIDTLKSDMDLLFLQGAIFSTFLVTLGGLMISHKMAGPLYRLKKEFKQMNQQGELHKITFRKNDAMEDFQKDLSELCDKVNK